MPSLFVLQRIDHQPCAWHNEDMVAQSAAEVMQRFLRRTTNQLRLQLKLEALVGNSNREDVECCLD